MASTNTDILNRASFIFEGTVVKLDASSLPVLPQRPGLAIVQFDRGFLVNPVLGKLNGRPITVQLAQEGNGAMRAGQRLIFLANAWVHGKEVAVNELAHVPVSAESKKEVESFVASLPERHLSERIATAALIVHGTVTEIARAEDIPRIPSEHDPLWMRAVIAVTEVVKGNQQEPIRGKGATVTLLFPGSRDIAFRNAPRPSVRQEAVYLLHRSTALPASAYITPDPADIQPSSSLATIRKSLGVK